MQDSRFSLLDSRRALFDHPMKSLKMPKLVKETISFRGPGAYTTDSESLRADLFQPVTHDVCNIIG